MISTVKILHTDGERSDGARALVPALDRAMRLLKLLEASPQRAYTMTEIAHQLDIPKSTAFNICGALAEGQLIRHVRDGFQLGRGLVELGAAYVSSVNLVSEFYDACRDVPVDLGARIQLAVLDEHLQTVYLALQDCNSGLRIGVGGDVGRRVPANCTACGKILLALLPRAELDRRLADYDKLPRLTRKSVVSRAQLMSEIGAAQSTGYAFDNEGAILGLSCVATGFHSPHADGGSVAVSVTALIKGITRDRKARIQATLDSVAAELRSRL